MIQQHLDKIFPALFKRIISPWPLWRIFPTAADKQLVRSVAEVNGAVDHFIAEARARMQADPSLRERPRNLLEAMIVDPALLGGLVVRIGSTMIDSSIRTRLNSLAHAMKG